VLAAVPVVRPTSASMLDPLGGFGDPAVPRTQGAQARANRSPMRWASASIGQIPRRVVIARMTS
jgi:hypothetical protein